MKEIGLNWINDWLKYFNIARCSRTRNIDNANKNSIRWHLIVNIKLAIKLKDENVEIGSVSFIDLVSK